MQSSNCVDAGLEVAGVVERIEDAEHVLAGGGIGADEGFHDIIRFTEAGYFLAAG